MRSLILGATGQIGSQLVRECEARNHVVAGTWYRRPHAEFSPLDLRDDEAVADLVAEFQPDVVYLAAGLTQVDYAEVNPAECDEVNAQGAATVARAAAAAGAVLVYVSSAQVFGECPTARKEDAAPAPVNAYGRAAAAAETAVRAALPGDHVILRTGHVYGPEERGRNVALHAVRRFADGDGIEAAIDRQCQPTYGPDLASAAADLVKHGCRGTFHAVGPDRMSEYAFAQLVAFTHGFDSDLVTAVKADRLCEDAPRAKTLWLDRFKLRSQLGPRAFRGAADGLRHLRDTADVPAPAHVRAA
jgi:dTDP-4-dehydrorhamnose reductase